MTSETEEQFVERVEANAIIAGADLSRLFALARRGAAVQWRPISEAPRTGRTLILMIGPSGFPNVAYANTWWQSGCSVECEPTHWMPLPPTPSRRDE